MCIRDRPWPALDLQLFGEDGQSGLFAEAKGGTLFLDEIGDLSESLQAKLLQVLAEYGQGTPEVRVISSSHQDLVTAMEEGRFREDVYKRQALIHKIQTIDEIQSTETLISLQNPILRDVKP